MIVKNLELQIEILGEKMATICKYNKPWEMPRVYYEIQRDYNRLKRELHEVLNNGEKF